MRTQTCLDFYEIVVVSYMSTMFPQDLPGYNWCTPNGWFSGLIWSNPDLLYTYHITHGSLADPWLFHASNDTSQVSWLHPGCSGWNRALHRGHSSRWVWPRDTWCQETWRGNHPWENHQQLTSNHHSATIIVAILTNDHSFTDIVFLLARLLLTLTTMGSDSDHSSLQKWARDSLRMVRSTQSSPWITFRLGKINGIQTLTVRINNSSADTLTHCEYKRLYLGFIFFGKMSGILI